MRHIWKFVPVILIAFYVMARQEQVSIVSTKEHQVKTIEVKGEVHTPGVYEVPWNASVEEVLLQAGGVSEQADLSSINQTRDLTQGEVLIIPAKKDQVCISINTATIEELDELPGIGEKIAQRIIDERTIAPFVQLEDIKRVKGIGDKLFEKMKDQICL